MTEDGVVIGRYRNGLVFGETTAPRIAATDDLRGIWHGSELLLEGGEQVWLLNVDEQQEAGGA